MEIDLKDVIWGVLWMTAILGVAHLFEKWKKNDS